MKKTRPLAPTVPIKPLDQFLYLSSILTGYTVTELQGAGTGGEYLAWLNNVLGERFCFALWAETLQISLDCAQDPQKAEREVGRRILKDQRFGPVARNIIAMWYCAIWWALPADWCDLHGANAADQNQVISPAAYQSALVWDVMGAHPPAAKPTGFGSWALPPNRERGKHGPA